MDAIQQNFFLSLSVFLSDGTGMARASGALWAPMQERSVTYEALNFLRLFQKTI